MELHVCISAMTYRTPPASGGDLAENLEPIFVSVKDAARLLGLVPWTVYRLCDSGKIKSQYEGKRRLVRLTSVRAYADSLPTERQDAS